MRFSNNSKGRVYVEFNVLIKSSNTFGVEDVVICLSYSDPNMNKVHFSIKLKFWPLYVVLVCRNGKLE